MRFLAIAALAILTGCSSVSPADRNVIAQQKANVVAMNEKIQNYKFKAVDASGNMTDAPWVKDWWKAEQDSWEALDAWANKRRATPAAGSK